MFKKLGKMQIIQEKEQYQIEILEQGINFYF